MATNYRYAALLLTRWAARLIGAFMIGLVLLIHIGEGPPPLRVMVSPLHLGMMSAIAGMAIGWWREGLGGLIVVIAATEMFAYELLTTGHLLGGVFPLFAGPGILLLLSRWQAMRLKPV